MTTFAVIHFPFHWARITSTQFPINMLLLLEVMLSHEIQIHFFYSLFSLIPYN